MQKIPVFFTATPSPGGTMQKIPVFSLSRSILESGKFHLPTFTDVANPDEFITWEA